MVTYKHKDFLEYMPDVKKYSEGISALNEQWDNIKLLCEIDCPVQSKKILPSMAKIQNSFFGLQQDLVDALITETLNKMEQKVVSKAQVAVDILIRNLYERTADVGFLATDDDIRRFVCLKEKQADDRDYIRNRLRAYVSKYSVYEEIIILDKDFMVLANLDSANNIVGTKIFDPLLEETLATKESFLEALKKSPLQADKEKAHIFSSKILAEGSDEVVGIICLCFRFENEMKGIFKKLLNDYDGSVIMIIDSANTVLASSDENHVPTGICVEPVKKNENGIVYYRGLEYISKTVSTQGYQGYFGLGWKGHIMIPVGLAFKEKAALKQSNPAVMEGLMSNADSFSKALTEIVGKTEEINNSLKRIVYNGQIITKEDGLNDEFYKLKPLLGAIGKMGNSTSLLFEKSIQNLFATVVSASLVDVSFLASLCIDIMDRNLYERSDDCRWWALNSTFKTILAHNPITEKDKEKLTKILVYINSLYTVYSNLFLFDRTGKIIAVSNPQNGDKIGKILEDEYIHKILRNSAEKNYYVSDFAASDLYENRRTYIYGASITNSANTVGGIGIVFDSEDQFRTMLKDSIPSKEDAFAVYTDRKGTVISSTKKSLAPGSKIQLPTELFEVENGSTVSEILIYDECYYSVGVGCSSGYREYKSSDDYRNDVLAFVFDKLADYRADDLSKVKNIGIDQSDVLLSENKTHQKLVTFAVNGQLFALNQAVVLEAIDGGNIIPIPGINKMLKGAVSYNKKYAAVVNTHALFGVEDTPPAGISHLILIKPSKDTMLALEADELVNVLEVDQSEIRPVPVIGGSDSTVEGIVSFPNAPNLAMLVLNHKNLLQKLEQNRLAADWEEMLPILEKLKAAKSVLPKQPPAAGNPGAQ